MSGGVGIAPRTVTLVILLASTLTAQEAGKTIEAPGCGSPDEQFKVKTTKKGQPIAQAAAGKALLYFVQDDREFESIPRPTVRAGIDGKWMGATHANSYAYFSVEPGEHHLCASWQSGVVVGAGQQSAALHFTAEAGKSYFFRIRDHWNKFEGLGTMIFEPLDSDEGKLLVSEFKYSTSHAKR